MPGEQGGEVGEVELSALNSEDEPTQPVASCGEVFIDPTQPDA